MARNYWVVTRPKRKLLLVPDLLKIFASIAEAQPWRGNRPLQLKFEQALTDAKWKAQNVSEDGSGGRTYAALLYMLGFWYEEGDQVFITNAGREIIDGRPPVPIITKQLLDMQFPSPYSQKPSVNVDRSFSLWPNRLVLKLLLEKGFDVITEKEIAFCLVPFAKNMNDIEECAKRIREYRVGNDAIETQAIANSGTTAYNLRQIGNTIVNQLEYTGFFIEEEDIRSLQLREDKAQVAKNALDQQRQSLISDPNTEARFQRRFGSGLQKSKDYSRSIREAMAVLPNERLILEKFYVHASNQPISTLTDRLVARISGETGAPEKLVKKVLSKLPVQLQSTQFKETYLKLSVGGRDTAKDFELKTFTLFHEGFGYLSEWVGNRPRHPDVIVYIDLVNKLHGVIDAKAYKKYSLPLDHKNIMAHTYVPTLAKITYKGESYRLAFFSYVSGGYGSTIKRSFDELREMTDVPGSYITARNLLRLFDLHNQKNLPSEKIVELFSSGDEITLAAIE